MLKVYLASKRPTHKVVAMDGPMEAFSSVAGTGSATGVVGGDVMTNSSEPAGLFISAVWFFPLILVKLIRLTIYDVPTLIASYFVSLLGQQLSITLPFSSLYVCCFIYVDH